MKLLLAILQLPFRAMATAMLEPDKIAHFYWGASMGISALWFGWWALLPIAIAATLKEGWDFMNPPHQCELLDFVATFIGGCIAVEVIMLRLHHVI